MADLQRVYEYQGELKSLGAWADQFGMSRKTLWRRLDKGMPIAEALETPTKVTNHQTATAKTLKDSMILELFKVWKTYGQEKFVEQVKAAFDSDAIKLFKDVYLPMLPKDAPVTIKHKEEKAAIRITFEGQPRQPMIIDMETELEADAE